MSEVAFYRSDELEAVLDRMARQALQQIDSPQDLVVVGVLRRGAPLADRLCERLCGLLRVDRIERLDLDIKRYADDLTLLFPETRLRERVGAAAPDLCARTVLLVDDVLYHGHSLLRAIDWLATRKPAAIRTAVLVDRACTRLPVKADVVGITLEVAPLQIVEAHVPPYEPDFALHIMRREVDDVRRS